MPSLNNKITFPTGIPSSLQDLEREPYNLEPYPNDFDEHGDEASRADSFKSLVESLQQGNRNLRAARGSAFATTDSSQQQESQEDEDDDEDPWMDRERVQNLYTLVR